MSASRFRGPRRQRGAIGLLGAIVMLLVATCIALALDTGRLYMEKRNLQRIADLTALEVASRVEEPLSGLTDEQLTESAEGAENVPELADLPSGDGFSITAKGGGLCRVPINVDGEGIVVRRFTAISKGASASCAAGGEALRRSAVHIDATRTTRASLAGALLSKDMVTLTATATAQPKPVEPMVTFSLGSRLLKADGSGLLGTLLGDDINVTAVGYEGLANATLSVGDLIDLAAEAGTANGLLEDVELNLADLLEISELQALARSQSADSNVLDAGVSLFSDAINGFIGLGLNAVRLSDILDVDPARADEALKAEVSLGSLLETMVFVAPEEGGEPGSLIDLERLGLDLGPLGGVELALDVIEPPQVAIGVPGCTTGETPCNGNWKTEVRTAQLRLGAQTEIKVSLLGIGLLSLDVLASVEVAEARAGIDEVESLGDGRYELATEAYHQPLEVVLSVGASLLSPGSALSDWLDGLGSNGGTGVKMSPSPNEIIWSPDVQSSAPFYPQSSGDVTDALFSEADTLAVFVDVAGINTEVPAGILLPVLKPVLSDLVSSALDPLIDLLGVRLSSADMKIIEVEPSAGGAGLVI